MLIDTNSGFNLGSVKVSSVITGEHDLEIELFAFALDSTGKMDSLSDFVFYNEDEALDGSLLLTDQTATISLYNISPEVERIAFCLSVYNPDENLTGFGTVEKLGLSVSGIIEHVVPNKGFTGTAAMFGELVRNGGQWEFNPTTREFKNSVEMMNEFEVLARRIISPTTPK